MDIDIAELVTRTKNTKAIWCFNALAVTFLGAGLAWFTPLPAWVVVLCTVAANTGCVKVIKMCDKNTALAENLLANNIYTVEDTRPKP